MASTTQTLRCLVACARCRRQYDAAALAAGSRFRCTCGEIVTVPRFTAQDAAVVRCSSCGAPRRQDEPACEHCGAAYTLHEQDLHTVCPDCMTRVSDRARFCHNCGTAILSTGQAGAPTAAACPACAGKSKLNSRALGEPPLAVLECPSCAGLWLGNETFRMLAERARDETLSEATELLETAGEPPATRAAGRQASLYRRCPECRRMMNRRNFGQRSGVVLDTCKEHGLWFDASELQAVLDFIRKGGEQLAAVERAAEERHTERLARLKVERPTEVDGVCGVSFGQGSESRPGLGGLLGLLFDA